MRILYAASEAAPFAKSGGLADVVGALAPVLAKKGHDVRVVLPLYTAIDSKWQQQMEFQLHFEVQLGWRRQYCGGIALRDKIREEGQGVAAGIILGQQAEGVLSILPLPR